ncbi:MAG: hypothetical protein JWM29_1770, partial [Solirubrobacterales bacterium]|nr:hypothetical protein [Solirubrobacterales bacterium]
VLRFGRQARWRQREEQELTRPLRNAPLQLHAPKRSQAPVHYDCSGEPVPVVSIRFYDAGGTPQDARFSFIVP